MKIVDVCAFYAPNGGGVRTYIDRKLQVGEAMGHEIVVIAPGGRNHVEERGPRAKNMFAQAEAWNSQSIIRMPRQNQAQ